MITLNMAKKHSPINVPISAFTTENNVLILQIKVVKDVGVDYDLIGKSITAIFKDKPETGFLQVVDGIIQLPITSNLVDIGINSIQLSFRWGTDKHELSQMMLWNVKEGLIPENGELPEVEFGLLNSLIYEVSTMRNEVDYINEHFEGSVKKSTVNGNILINEVETKVYDDSAKANILQPSLITPTFTNNWVKYDTNPVGYFKDTLGFVHFQGRVKSGTVGAFIFTLPTGYIPTSPKHFPCVCGDSTIGMVYINTTGGVLLVFGNNTYVSLDSIYFRV